MVTGTVTEVDARGATVDLGNGIEGYMRVSEISLERVEDARMVVKSAMRSRHGSWALIARIVEFRCL